LASAMPQQGQPPSTPQSSPQTAQQNKPSVDGQSGEGMTSDKAGNFIGSTGPQGTIAQVVAGLKPKDREAVALLQKEKAPAEYQGMAGQYLKNLAAGESPATPLP
jgi:hypothetical protein